MKDLIVKALNDSIIILDKRTPQTKKETVYISIEDVNPLELAKFIIDNNIPNDCYFNGKPNSYDSFDIVCLSYEINVPTTEKEILKYKRDKFNTIAFKEVFNSLTNNGYKRVGFNSGLLRKFDNVILFDAYTNKDFDTLVSYYSLSFIPV